MTTMTSAFDELEAARTHERQTHGALVDALQSVEEAATKIEDARREAFLNNLEAVTFIAKGSNEKERELRREDWMAGNHRDLLDRLNETLQDKRRAEVDYDDAKRRFTIARLNVEALLATQEVRS